VAACSLGRSTLAVRTKSFKSKKKIKKSGEIVKWMVCVSCYYVTSLECNVPSTATDSRVSKGV
jgi:hypothetical protein